MALRDLGLPKGEKERIQVYNGPYGLYVKQGKVNASIPKGKVADEDIASRSRRALPERLIDEGDKWPDDDGNIFPPLPPGFFDPHRDQWPSDELPPFVIGTRCKVRPDGTLYDCVDETLGTDITDDTGNIDGDLGNNDVFNIPTLGPDSCSPYFSDSNIKPITCYKEDGSTVVVVVQ